MCDKTWWFILLKILKLFNGIFSVLQGEEHAADVRSGDPFPVYYKIFYLHIADAML